MKKKLYLLTTIIAGATALLLSSCLKDKSHYVNFDTGQTFVDFPKGGFSGFGPQAITELPADSVNGQPNTNGAITRVFAVNVASQSLPTSPTTVTLGVDTSLTAVLNKEQSDVHYLTMPANAYSFTGTKVTIAAGQQYAETSITFYKALLDPALSYVIPIVIKNGGGQKISSNLNVLYYHFIGNDFAGLYEHYFTRYNVPDTTDAANLTAGDDHTDEGTDTFFPVSANEFTVVSDYYTALLPYDVSFTKTGTGASALYSNWKIQFRAADIAQYWTPAGITLGAGPSFDPNTGPPPAFPAGFDPSASYTYAQSLKIFRFYYTTATRAVIDEYIK